MKAFGPLILGGNYTNKLPIAANFRNQEERETLWGSAFRYIYTDDVLVPNDYVAGVGPITEGVPNLVHWAPHDWPKVGEIIRYPQVIRVVVINDRPVPDMYLPGDSGLSERYGLRFSLEQVPEALEAMINNRGVKFCLHCYPLDGSPHPDTEYASPRFLRAIAPCVPDFFGTDVLNIVLLCSGFTGVSAAASGFQPFSAPFGYDSYGVTTYGIGTSIPMPPFMIHDPPEGTWPYFGSLNASFYEDAQYIIDAYDRFPRYRSVLYNLGPDSSGQVSPFVTDAGIVNGQDIWHLDKAVLSSSLALQTIADALAGYGVEYGGYINPLSASPAAIVELAATHFGL
jgi:hypothetical protein